MLSILKMFKNNWNLVLKRKTVFNSVFLENLFTSYSWKSRKIKPGKFQIGQKYFAKEIRKSLKHQKIIVTVEKLSDYFGYSWSWFLEGILQLVLLSVLFLVINERTLCYRLYLLFEEHFYMKINVISIPMNIVTN